MVEVGERQGDTSGRGLPHVGVQEDARPDGPVGGVLKSITAMEGYAFPSVQSASDSAA